MASSSILKDLNEKLLAQAERIHQLEKDKLSTAELYRTARMCWLNEMRSRIAADTKVLIMLEDKFK